MKLKPGKSLGIKHNVYIRVIDPKTHEIVQEHVGHNMATNSMLLGIAHYLVGDGVLNQGSYMLSNFVPRYISLGTMGLVSQNSDENGLPTGIGVEYIDPETMGQLDPELKEQYDDAVAEMNQRYQDLLDALEAAYIEGEHILTVYCTPPGYDPDEEELSWSVDNDPCSADCENCPCPCGQSSVIRNVKIARERYRLASEKVENFDEQIRLSDYMAQRPGYGADGYDANENNGRKWFGLGPKFANREDQTQTINCELISDSFPRSDISFRDIVPEIESELPMTIDVVFSAMLSTGALKAFREEERNYLYITECGLWSKKEWEDSGENGLLAAYRIAPPDEWNWYMLGNALRKLLKAGDVNAYNAFYQYLKMLSPPGSEDPIVDHIDEIISNEDETELKALCEDFAEYNRNILKRSVIRVGLNQIVQIIWKIQIGSIDQFASIEDLRKQYYKL